MVYIIIFVKFFKNAYDKAGYLDKYGDSVIMTVLTLLAFFCYL